MSGSVGAVPRLHPRLADLYRDNVERLQESLNAEATRREAAKALRSLIEEMRLVPVDGQLQIELAGDLAGILALTANRRKPASELRRLQVTLVAGTPQPPTVYNQGGGVGSNRGPATSVICRSFGPECLG